MTKQGGGAEHSAFGVMCGMPKRSFDTDIIDLNALGEYDALPSSGQFPTKMRIPNVEERSRDSVLRIPVPVKRSDS